MKISFDWNIIPEKEYEKYQKRVALVETLLDRDIGRCTKQKTIDEYCDHNGITKRTVRNYVKRYKKKGPKGLLFYTPRPPSPRIKDRKLRKKIICMVCKKNYSIDEVYKNLDKELPPRCSCGGILRPDVVFFGEMLPRKALTYAENAAKNCEVFMVLGSSLLVYPAAHLPLIAKRNGVILIIINIDITPMDEIADINIHKSASQVLSEIIN